MPVKVAAAGGNQILQLRATTLQELSGTVPDIQLSNFASTLDSAVVSIRGIGVVEPYPYADNTVSIVYNGAPNPFRCARPSTSMTSSASRYCAARRAPRSAQTAPMRGQHHHPSADRRV